MFVTRDFIYAGHSLQNECQDLLFRATFFSLPFPKQLGPSYERQGLELGWDKRPENKRPEDNIIG